MEYKKYYNLSFPMEKRISEQDKSILWKFNRLIAIRQSYIFYHLGFTANFLSIVRVFLALFGVFLLFISSNALLFFLGFFLIAWQVNLDFADGCLARITNTKDPYGTIIDGLATEFVRICMILFSSLLADSIYLFIIGILALYATQIVHYRIYRKNNQYLQGLKYLSSLIQVINSVLFSNIFLPFVLLLTKFSMLNIEYYYYSVITIYLIAAIPLYVYLIKSHKYN